MCLAIPAQIQSINGVEAHVDVGGVGRTINLYIDGTLCPDYDTQTAAVGAIVSDAGTHFSIGSDIQSDYGFTGAIGWLRVSDSIRAFTPAIVRDYYSRCKPPPVDGSTVALWIYEGVGDTLDNLEGTAALDGDVDVAVWSRYCGDDCLIGRGDTCTNEVFIANKGSYMDANL